MSNPQNPQSIFPDFPHQSPVIDKDGDFTNMWSLSLGALYQALQKNFKNEGILFPSLTAAQITSIQALYTPFIGLPLPSGLASQAPPYSGYTLPDISGQTVFDTTNRVSWQFVITYDGATPPNILSASWQQLTYMSFYAGNPNSNVAGNVGWLCYNTTGSIMYICTVSGSKTTTTWTAFT